MPQHTDEPERATPGLVGWVEPLLAGYPERDCLVGELREVSRLRVAVVHGLPELDGFEEQVVWKFRYQRPVTGEDGQTVDERGRD